MIGTRENIFPVNRTKCVSYVFSLRLFPNVRLGSSHAHMSRIRPLMALSFPKRHEPFSDLKHFALLAN